MEPFDVIVIGGGASGLMAAGTAAESGKRVLLIEKMFRPGRKLRITGKGRCNLTNLTDVDDFLTHIGSDPDFLRPAFKEFFAEDLIKFFHSIRIKTKTERGRRVFPQSDKAQDVVDGMHQWVEKKGIKILSKIRITKLIFKDGEVRAVRTEKNKLYFAKQFIMCTGGASYPATGSTGDGYKIIEKLGHKINPINPCLVPLKVDFDFLNELDRLSLRNIKISVYQKDELITEKFGEMMFLKHAISGPLILTLSRELGKRFEAGEKFDFKIDLKPALSEEKIRDRIKRELEQDQRLVFKSLLRKLLPSQMINVFLNELNIEGRKLVKDLEDRDVKCLIRVLKSFKLKVIGMCGFDEAIVTSGGVDLNEVDSRTMRSKLLKNLYFAGELLDLDANTGGYNLQIAFSTGRLAGISAAKN